MSSHKYSRVSILAPLLFSALVSFVPAMAIAQSDSVAIILRSEKVLIQINEAGSSSRLQSLFDVIQVESSFLLLSRDRSVKLDCARDADSATCVIRFLPSSFVTIGERDLNVFIPWQEINIEVIPSAEGHWMFESSRGDHLEIQVTSKGLRVFGNKK